MKSLIANAMLLVKERVELLIIHAVGLVLSAVAVITAPSLAVATPFILMIGALIHFWAWKFTEYGTKPFEMAAYERNGLMGIYCLFFGLISMNLFMMSSATNMQFALIQHVLLGYYVAARILPRPVGCATEFVFEWLTDALAPFRATVARKWSSMWNWAENNKA